MVVALRYADVLNVFLTIRNSAKSTECCAATAMPHTFGHTNAALMRSLPSDCETLRKAVNKTIMQMFYEDKDSDIKLWADLTPDEKDAAGTLQYTRNKWDTVGETLWQCDKDGRTCHPPTCHRRLIVSVSSLSCHAAFCV